MPKLRPLKDRILVKPDVRVLSTILEVQNNEQLNSGTVIACGPGHYLENGKFMPQQCKVGDKIRFGTMGDDEYLKYPEYVEDGISYRILSWQDVCFVVPE